LTLNITFDTLFDNPKTTFPTLFPYPSTIPSSIRAFCGLPQGFLPFWPISLWRSTTLATIDSSLSLAACKP